MSRRLQGGEFLLVVGGVARCHGAPLPCGQPATLVLAGETHRCRAGAGERQHRALAREDQPPPLLHGLGATAGVHSCRQSRRVLSISAEPHEEEEEAVGVVGRSSQGESSEALEAEPKVDANTSRSFPSKPSPRKVDANTWRTVTTFFFRDKLRES